MTSPEIKPNSPKALLPYVGYGLVLFSLLDLLIFLYPPQFLDFTWEYNTFNYFVDSSAGTVVGFWIVLSRELAGLERYKIEKVLNRFLAWITLILAIIYFLLVPFGISAAFRLHRNNGFLATNQQNQGLQQLETIRSRVNSASDADLGNLQRQVPNNPSNPLPANNPTEFRKALLAQLDAQANNIREQTKTAIANSRQAILKRTLKSVLGALIVSFIFLRLWLQDPKRKESIASLVFARKRNPIQPK